jgi:hypothetical protein
LRLGVPQMLPAGLFRSFIHCSYTRPNLELERFGRVFFSVTASALMVGNLPEK